MFYGYTLCGTFLCLFELIQINLIKNYSELASIKTILFFALSMKLASEFLRDWFLFQFALQLQLTFCKVALTNFYRKSIFQEN